MNGLNCSKEELIRCGPAAFFFLFLVPGLIELLTVDLRSAICYVFNVVPDINREAVVGRSLNRLFI